MSMKKSAVAVALLAAMGAQAQVTLFGTLDLNLSSVKDVGEDSRVTSVSSSGLTDSYLGLAVQEDLGGGLKASAQLETLIAVDTGGTGSPNFWGRNANVSLSSEALGTLTVGRKQTIFFDSVAAYNPFGEANLGVSRKLFNNLLQTGAGQAIVDSFVNNDQEVADQLTQLLASEDRSWQNSITYQSPNFNGLSGAVQISLKEAVTDASNNAAATVNYEAGPFAVGFAYQATNLGAVAAAGLEDTRWLLGASYDLGMAKLYGQLSQSEWQTTAGTKVLETTAFQLGASIPLSEQGTAMVSLGQAKDDTSGNPTDKVTAISLGYDHALSKRTDVYGVFKSVRETDETSGTGLAVGVRHRF
jgi:predicted porin